MTPTQHATLTRKCEREYRAALRAEEQAPTLPLAWWAAAASERCLRRLRTVQAGLPLPVVQPPRTRRNLAAGGLAALAAIGRVVARALTREASLTRARLAAALAHVARKARKVTRCALRRAVAAVVAALATVAPVARCARALFAALAGHPAPLLAPRACSRLLLAAWPARAGPAVRPPGYHSTTPPLRHPDHQDTTMPTTDEDTMTTTDTTTTTDAPTDDAAERFALLEMDDAPAVAPKAPKAAPAITVAPKALVSPLVAGRALLDAAPDLAALTDAAHAVARVCVAAGIGETHPTRLALREAYHARRAALAAAVLAAPVTPPTPAPATGGLDLGAVLGEIAAEGATNATSQASGSLADGTMRIVGFSSAAGYVTALANGTKEPTTSQYLATLRNTYGYTAEQIAALTVTTIHQAALPEGVGVVVDNRVNGVDIFARQRAEHIAAAKLVRDTADATTLALAQRLVVADSPDAWWEIGWRGVGSITRAALVAATGSVTLAPDPKISSTQLARTIDLLRGTHDAAQVATRPRGVKVRWQIGRGAQHAAYVGAEYGQVLAIVDLHSDNTLTFDGDVTIADEVRAEYSRLCGDEVLRPGDVTTWLQQVLRQSHGAVRSGERFLLAPQHKRAARELCAAVAAVWSVGNWTLGRLGDDGVPELGVTYQDVATVIGGIWQGLANEVTEAEERWSITDATATAKKPGVRACVNELERLDGTKPGEGLQARLGQLAIIGEGPLAPLRARVVALRACVKAALDEANDPTAERFANLELA